MEQKEMGTKKGARIKEKRNGTKRNKAKLYLIILKKSEVQETKRELFS